MLFVLRSFAINLLFSSDHDRAAVPPELGPVAPARTLGDGAVAQRRTYKSHSHRALPKENQIATAHPPRVLAGTTGSNSRGTAARAIAIKPISYVLNWMFC